NQTIESIVGVVDRLLQRSAGSLEQHFREPVAMVVGVFDIVAAGNFRAPRAVPLIVVLIRKNAVGIQLVVGVSRIGAGGHPGGRAGAIPIGIVGVALVGEAGVIGPGQLA